MNIVRLRLERALKARFATTVAQRERTGRRRRSSYKRGEATLVHKMEIRIDTATKLKLEAMCKHLNSERGVIVRDAIAMYLGIAEGEFAEELK